MDVKRRATERQSCWTCKDRKIRCDGASPVCINCRKSKRECTRLAMRLSWPTPKDGRRLIINQRVLPGRVVPEREPIFLNTFDWDITLQEGLGKRDISPAHFSAWPSEMPSELSPMPRSGTENQMLIAYFTSMLPHLLAPFGDNRGITQLLLRIAFMDETPASSAVLQGILALSSLKLHGNLASSFFKSKAIAMLAASVKEQMDPSEHLRCLAASLLLSLYKTSSNTDTEGGWTFFVCGAIKLAKAMSLPHVLGTEEIILFDWLSCHTIFAEFSTSHWVQYESCVYRQPCTEDEQLRSLYSLIPDRSRILSFSGCSLEFLDILLAIRSVVVPQSHPEFLSREHKKQLDGLELCLISIQQHGDFTASTLEENQAMRIAELYRLAGLVYLHRAGRRSRIGFPPTETVLERAYAVLEQLEMCESVWPLFIVGCEARSDEHRLLILRKLSKLLQIRNTSNMWSIKAMIEASWKQADLCEEESQEPDYVVRINALISAGKVLPIFL